MKHSNALDTSIYALCLLAPWSLLWLDTRLLFPYETGKAWAFRSIVELAFALLICKRLITRPTQTKIRFDTKLMLALLIAFLFWSFATGMLGIDAYRSFWSNYERMAGLVAYFHWALYLLCLLAVLDVKRAQGLLINLLIVITAVCLLGLFETEKRVISSLGNPIYLGNMAVLGLFLSGLFVAGRPRGQRWRGLPSWFWALPALIILSATLLKTASRGAFLALAVGLVVVAIGGLSGVMKRFRLRTRIMTIASLVFLIVVLISQMGVLQRGLKNSESYALQRIGQVSLQDQTTADRLQNWKIALGAAQEHPLLGWGQENYTIAFTEHYRAGVMDNADIWFDRAHNTYLDVLVASGVPGLFLYLMLLISPILITLGMPGWSRWQKAFAAGFWAAMLAKNLVGLDTFSSSLLWFSLLAMMLAQTSPRVITGQLIHSGPRLGLMAPILVAVSGVIFVLNIQPYRANLNLAALVDKQQLLGSEEFDQQIASLQNGKRYGRNARLAVCDTLLTKNLQRVLTPLEIKHQEQLFQLAGKLASEELIQQPRNYRIKYNASLLLARFGHYALARKLLEELSVAAPQRTVFWHSLAQVYAAMGDVEQVAAARSNIHKLNPDWKPK